MNLWKSGVDKSSPLPSRWQHCFQSTNPNPRQLQYRFGSFKAIHVFLTLVLTMLAHPLFSFDSFPGGHLGNNTNGTIQNCFQYPPAKPLVQIITPKMYNLFPWHANTRRCYVLVLKRVGAKKLDPYGGSLRAFAYCSHAP